MLARFLAPMVLLAAPALPPTAAAKSNHAVDAVASATLGAQGIEVQMRGKPFGSCRGTAITVAGGAIFNTNCSGGHVTVAIRFSTGRGKGSWRITKVTGRYAGGSGRGTFKGSLVTLRFRLRGNVRY